MTAALYRARQIVRLRYGRHPDVCHLHDEVEAEKQKGKLAVWIRLVVVFNFFVPLLWARLG